MSIVPSGLQLLTSLLTDLNLSSNRLTCIPNFLGECEQLQYLDFQQNYLQDLPDELSSLKKLKELCLSYNLFDVIPACVFEMEKMEILVAEHNKLTYIDVKGLTKLQNIQTLNLSNNNIRYVPPELGNLTQLRYVEISGNIFRQPRHAILQKGTSALLAYLRSRIP